MDSWPPVRSAYEVFDGGDALVEQVQPISVEVDRLVQEVGEMLRQFHEMSLCRALLFGVLRRIVEGLTLLPEPVELFFPGCIDIRQVQRGTLNDSVVVG